MLKLLHTSDWHLGKMLFGRSLYEDQQYFIERVFFPAVEEHAPDAVILAGDIFDRPVAPASAIRLFDGVVTRLCGQMHIPFVCITGNHDGPDRLCFGAELMRSMGFYLRTAADPSADPVVLESGGETAAVYPLPYFDPPTARDLLGRGDLKTAQDAYAAMLGELVPRLDPAACNLLVAHCFAAGSATCESESALSVGGVSEVSPQLFAPFAYTALGHLHGPQSAGGCARYSGSPLQYSFDEERQTKSMTLVEIENGAVRTRPLPIAPLRRVRTLRGTFEQLAAAAQDDPAREDYLFITLEGDPVYEPMLRLREFYPNVLGLTNGRLGGAGGSAQRDALREGLRGGSNDLAVFEAFVSQMCGDSVSQADRDVFSEACARVDRADG